MKKTSISVSIGWVGIIVTLLLTILTTTGFFDNKYQHTVSAHGMEYMVPDSTTLRTVIAKTNARITIDTLHEVTDNEVKIINIQGEHGLAISKYKIYQCYHLNAINNVLKGNILMLIDKRLTGLKATAKHDNLYAITEYNFISDEKANSIESDTVYNNAALLMVDEHLKIVWQNILDRSCARIDTCALYGNSSHPSFLLTIDYSAGFGSYNGPISYFIEPTHENIAYIVDKKGFMTSLKSEWMLIAKDNVNKVLYKFCRPADYDTMSKTSDIKFTTFYNQYCYQSGTWIATKRTEDGIWENEMDENDTDALKSFVGEFK